MERDDLSSILDHIDCGSTTHDEWLDVGMALKHEGYPVAVWDMWSATDSARYKTGECDRRWRSFNGNSNPVTGGTIVSMAYERGWRPKRIQDDSDGYELAWDAVIGKNVKVFDERTVEKLMLSEPENWDPVKDISEYLRILFQADENVGYVTKSWQDNTGKYLPTQGHFDRTAGQLLEELSICDGDICGVFGDYNDECGAWIRFNPVDGKGVKNDNITNYRWALVESDNMELSKQNALIRKLQLPVATLTHSGGKSLHAIVNIDASSKEEYDERVQFLYNICESHGMTIDRQNKNPSRLSRMPGVTRNGNKQYLIDTRIGKKNWIEWREYIDSVSDGMPDIENLADMVENPVELSPVLIEGTLRKGHKMMIAGASKAGKSFLLMQLCLAISNGSEWIGLKCAQGKVLYINMEIDPASCRQRFEKIATEKKYDKSTFNNIDIWNLRGKTESLDKMVPPLVRRAKDNGYAAIILDPIYKVQNGDENSAGDIGKFCNQLDKICSETGASVIYCHHHSKGDQADKRASDRASGSGVFARDADALLDLIELDATEVELTTEHYLNGSSAWRVESTLREFKPLETINLFFKYPIHATDGENLLEDVGVYRAGKTKAERAEESRKKMQSNVDRMKTGYEVLDRGNGVHVLDMAEYMGCSDKSIRRYIKSTPEFMVNDGMIKLV